jgi:tetratricopeptide (TPR) repeat protein
MGRSICTLMVSPVLMVALVSAQRGPRAVTFADDIAPIIRSRCVTCHQPDGDAPFSLASHDEVRRRASMIVAVTKSGYMPPWKPVDGFGDFRGTRRMTADEIATIERWVSAGMGPSAGADAGPAPETTNAWEHGEPDLILTLPQYTLRADGPDVFRNFVVAVPVASSRFVRGLQFRPRSRAVHHANIRVDSTTGSRRLDEADPAPGYEGVIARSADFPDGHFLGWTPGQLAPVLSDELTWQLRSGSDLVVQLHLRPTGKTEEIAPVVGFYLSERPGSQTPTMIRLGRQDLDVPAGAPAYAISDSFVLPVDVEVHAVQPHSHYRARAMQAWANLPDGSRRALIRIDDWDMNWQDRYVYQTPFRLAAATRLTLDFVFDNSVVNPRNPDRPPVRARWGWRSTDEMADLWIQVMTGSEGDRARLQREVAQKMLTEDAIGSEVLLEREPSHVNLRNDVAAIYLALGQPARALPHFESVRRLQPQSGPAWFNEGVALEALARLEDAEARYAEAIRLDPAYSAAHNNIGTLRLRKGDQIGARAAFERAVAADPRNGDAQANLGMAMIANGESDAGLEHVRRALDVKPELLTGMVPHVFLLAAHSNPTARRPAEARALAERISRAMGERDAAALDALAACHAALGSFDEALRIASTAESAAPSGSPDLRDAIRARIALYRAGKPFVLP